MVPQTFPSQVNSLSGRREMIVYSLPSVSGLTRWIDYIPVKFASATLPQEGVVESDGFIAIAPIGSTTGLSEFVDYIPVYVDSGATDAWVIDSVGYIPVEHSGVSLARYIRTFNGIDTYGTLNTPQVFTGDYEVEVPVAIPNGATGALQVITGGSSSYFGVSSAGNIVFRAEDGGTAPTGVAPSGVTPFDGKLHTWKLKRVGTTATLYIDDVQQLQHTGTGADSTWSHVGVFGTLAFFFAGSILSVKFTDNSGASPVVTNYVIDNDSTVYTQARGYVLGSDVNRTPNLVNSPWVDNGDGSYTIDGSQVSSTTIFWSSLLSSNTIYEIKVIATNVTAGFFFANNADDASATVSADGTYTLYVNNATNNNLNITANADFAGTVEIVYIAPRDRAITWANFAASDIQLVTYNNQYSRWEGEEKLADGGFDTACGVNWICGVGWTISGGKATHAAGTGSDIEDIFVTISGVRYLTVYALTGITAGNIQAVFKTGGTASDFRTIDGVYTDVLTGGTGNFVFRASSAFDGSIDTASVKQVWEYV